VRSEIVDGNVKALSLTTLAVVFMVVAATVYLKKKK